MKRAAVLAAVGIVLAVAGGCQPSGDGMASNQAVAAGTRAYIEEEAVIKRARDMVYPATVRVEARKTEYFGGQKKRTGGFGSGVILDPEGHILTNYHVAGRAEELSCTLYNKERVKAKLVGADPWTDLAVIQLDMDEVKDKGVEIEWAPFGDSSTMSEGEAVLAIGSPYGLSRSISNGIISCHDRILGEAMDLGGGLETGLFNTWLQTDAAINPGNSGGPLVNLRGEVIGINTRGGGNDLGFAVPINVAKDVVRQILTNGKVTRSDVGMRFQPLQDLESFFEVGKTEGAIVSSVEADGPAAKAGVMPQDILMEYNGAAVQGRYPEQLFELRRRIADTRVGTEGPIKVKRAGETLSMTLTTRELTTVRSDEVNFDKWGFVGQNITGRLAERENLKDTKGVYITGVRTGEPAEKAQLDEGDVVFRIGDTDVNSVEEMRKVYDESVEKKQKSIFMKVQRGLAVLLKVLTVSYPDEGAAPAKAGEKAAEKTPEVKAEGEAAQ